MKFNSLILIAIFSFSLFSCDSGVKFNNPNDINSDAYQGGDTETQDIDEDKTDTVSESDDSDSGNTTPDDSNTSDDEDASATNNSDDDTETNNDFDTSDSTPDNDLDTDQGRKQGELYGECYPNDTCNAGLICDVENNICIKDNGETSDDSDSDIENPLPECSASSGTPCYDSASGLTWSAKASGTMTWSNAKSYCSNYSESGLNSWRLPTISELRTLIQDCPGTQVPPSGSNICGVRDESNFTCLEQNCWTSIGCASCTSDSSGGHSKFSDIEFFWSSSSVYDKYYAWSVDFSYGNVYISDKSHGINIRCVR